MSTDKKEYLKAEAEKIGITLDEHQIDQFVKYHEMLEEKNKVMNLTAITEYEEVVRKHFIDSLSIIKAVDISKANHLIDLGTGAGFPGIPLKIAFPNIHVTLADSLEKRIRFLDEVIGELGLTNIDTVHGRAEDLARNQKYREMYDICTSRAVARLATLCEYCIPFVKVNGMFVSYKSGQREEEVKEASRAIRLLGSTVERQTEFELYDMGRSIITIRKTKHTAPIYPRKAGTPGRKPLI